MNQWLTNQGYPTIPAGATYRQVINAICTSLNHTIITDGSKKMTWPTMNRRG
jgi:hypothetical protein